MAEGENGEKSCPVPIQASPSQPRSILMPLFLGEQIILGCRKTIQFFFMAPKSDGEGSHFPSDTCPERAWWDLEKKHKGLGITSLSLHSDCKPNLTSSSLQKEEKKLV